MIREIIRDQFFLRMPSRAATPADIAVANDLLDTLRANADSCVGMAANMIGYLKRIIAVQAGPFTMVMINPEILMKDGAYETSEGCLSLTGTRSVRRYRKIRVRYQTMDMKTIEKEFSDAAAQIIQHECDHLDGRII